MPKKKSKTNGFLCFMLEWKTNEEKKGSRFPNGLKDVQTDSRCIKAWQDLSPDQKNEYKVMAKSTNACQSSNMKRTGYGELITNIEKNKILEQEFHDNMTEYISSIINTAKSNNNLSKIKFYVIHINYFYSRVLDNFKVEYYPAEISIIEFSLQKGILRVYHEIINEKIKIGYSNTAKEQSLRFHQIPVESEFGKSDYEQIFQDICKFLAPGNANGKLPPLYTFCSNEEVYEPIKSCLNRIAIANCIADNYFVLYSIEYLFSSIYNAATEDAAALKMDYAIAALELKKDPFVYKSDLACNYHSQLNTGLMYCSESIVKRWIFVVTNVCCTALGIPMMFGFHKPKENIYIDEFLSTKFSEFTLNKSKYNSTAFQSRDKCGNSDLENLNSKTNIKQLPIKIIDHSKINDSMNNPPDIIERPLRIPFTKSAVTYFIDDKSDMDYHFPAIGRGKRL